MIHIKCPKCGDFLSVPDSQVGEAETCPNCGNVVVVQKPEKQQDRSSESHDTPDSSKKELRLKLGGEDDPTVTAWGFGLGALGAILGGAAGAARTDIFDDPVVGLMLGGVGGSIVGLLLGVAIGCAVKAGRKD